MLQVQGYTAAGQTEYALDSLRWIADYFVQNHHADLAFTGQIGNVGDDHSSWGRPEDMTEDRPGFDLTPTAPGDFSALIPWSVCSVHHSPKCVHAQGMPPLPTAVVTYGL